MHSPGEIPRVVKEADRIRARQADHGLAEHPDSEDRPRAFAPLGEKSERVFDESQGSPIQGSPRLPGGNGFPALLATGAVSIGSSRALAK
jgi:hypothetical protein